MMGLEESVYNVNDLRESGLELTLKKSNRLYSTFNATESCGRFSVYALSKNAYLSSKKTIRAMNGILKKAYKGYSRSVKAGEEIRYAISVSSKEEHSKAVDALKHLIEKTVYTAGDVGVVEVSYLSKQKIEFVNRNLGFIVEYGKG